MADWKDNLGTTQQIDLVFVELDTITSRKGIKNLYLEQMENAGVPEERALQYWSIALPTEQELQKAGVRDLEAFQKEFFDKGSHLPVEAIPGARSLLSVLQQIGAEVVVTSRHEDAQTSLQQASLEVFVDRVLEEDFASSAFIPERTAWISSYEEDIQRAREADIKWTIAITDNPSLARINCRDLYEAADTLLFSWNKRAMSEKSAMQLAQEAQKYARGSARN